MLFIRSCFLLTVALSIIIALPARSQNVTHLIPVAFNPGVKTRVRLYGQGLAAVRNLWTSFDAQVQWVSDAPATDNEISFDITPDAKTAVGMYGLRGIGPEGISDVRLVVIDDLPVALEGGQNKAPATPQELTIPGAVDGFILPEQTLFYAINVTANQSLSFEVVGYRLGTGFDPLLRISGPDGKELISHDNDEGLGYDSRFTVTFPAAGRYIVELRDTRFQGGVWPYHLRIGDFPITRATYPAGGQRGQQLTVAFPGHKASDVPPATVKLDGKDPSPFSQCAVQGGSGSTWLTLEMQDGESQLELEPNDAVATANPIKLGRTLDGRLERAGDVDAYSFQARKGAAIYFRGLTKRIASPADLYLRVVDIAGNQLQASDDEGTNDGELTFTSPAEGTFVLIVEDLNHRGGVEFVYRIDTESPRTDFVLRPAKDQIVVPRGGHIPLAVAIDRLGMGDAVTLTTAAAMAGIVSRPAEIGTGAPVSYMTLEVAPDAPMGVTSLQVFGESTTGAKTRRIGLLSPLLRPKLDNVLLIPPSVDTKVAVSVVDRSFFSLKAALQSPAAARFTNTPLVIEATREKFADEPIELAVENAPQNIVINPQPIPKGARSVTLNVESKPGSPIGRFPIVISGRSTFAGRGVRSYAEVLYLDVRAAAALTVAPPEVTIKPGETIKVTVKGERLPAYKGALPVSLINLPTGVSATSGTIAEGQAEVVLDLTAAADAPLTAVDNVIARSAFDINGQKETSDSAPLRLKIVAAK